MQDLDFTSPGLKGKALELLLPGAFPWEVLEVAQSPLGNRTLQGAAPKRLETHSGVCISRKAWGNNALLPAPFSVVSQGC